MQNAVSEKNTTVLITAGSGFELSKKNLEILSEFFGPHSPVLILNESKFDSKTKEEILKSKNDILILSSNAELTDGCLQEMEKVLKDHDKHGLVCPRSNNSGSFDQNKDYVLWQKIANLLPPYNTIPSVEPFCVLIKNDLIKNFGFLEMCETFDYVSLNKFICHINRAGYSAVQANRYFVYNKNSTTNNKAEDKKIISTYPEYEKKINDYMDFYLHPLERFAPVFLQPKPKFLFYLADLPPVYSGTSISALSFWQHSRQKLCDFFDVYIYIPRQTFEFFKKQFGDVPHVIYAEDEIREIFALAYKPYQIFNPEDLRLLNKVALKFAFTLLDIISLRCDYLRQKERFYTAKQALIWADGATCISDYVREDTEKFFNSKFDLKTIYPYAIDEISKEPSSQTDKILLIGNSFAHKLTKQAIVFLKNVSNLTVLGSEPLPNYPQITFHPSGKLNNEEMESLYHTAKILIYPSQYEGFGIPLLEAAKFNKPIIAHDNPCSREVVEKFQINNVYFYKQLEEIEGMIDKISAESIKPQNELAISWSDLSSQLTDYLIKIHSAALDMKKFSNRHEFLSLMELSKEKKESLQKNIILNMSDKKQNQSGGINDKIATSFLKDKFEKSLYVLKKYPSYVFKNPELIKNLFVTLFKRGPYQAMQNAYDFIKLQENRVKETPVSPTIKKEEAVKIEDQQAKYNDFIIQREKELLKIKEYLEEADGFQSQPPIAMISTLRQTKSADISKTVESLQNQLYKNWILFLGIKNIDEDAKKNIRRFADNDQRIKIFELTEEKNNYEFLFNKLETDYFGLIDIGDTLAPDAFYETIKTLRAFPDTEFIYADEDRINQKNEYFFPYFKPDWSPDLHLSSNYTNRFAIYKKSVIIASGGFEEKYESYPDFDLSLKITEKTNKIQHISKILYHKKSENKTDYFDPEDYPRFLQERRALLTAIERRHLKAKLQDGLFPPYYLRYEIKENSFASIIIPTKDKVGLLKNCIESILKKTSFANYEIIIIDNNSKETSTKEYYEFLKEVYPDKIKVVEYNQPFNFSAINNYAVKKAKGDVYVFLNNDTIIINEEWLTVLVEQAQRKEVGAVGCKLLYPNRTLQHGGVIIGLSKDNYTNHAFLMYPETHPLTDIVRNFNAVTAACIAVRKEVFDEINGFDEIFAVPFNDIDLCLRLRAKDYLVIYTPLTQIYHLESATRGVQDWPEDTRIFKERWGELIFKTDKYYNPNLSSDPYKTFEWRGY